MYQGSEVERVHRALRSSITGGRLPRPDHLDIGWLARTLETSQTPVREALFRLVGERLVEPDPHGGFRLPAPSDEALSSLYALQADLVLAALGRRAASWPPSLAERPRTSDLAYRAGELLQGIGAMAGDVELERSLQQVGDRLAEARLVEWVVLSDVETEVAVLETSVRSRPKPTIRRLIGVYHRRRISHASRIAWAVSKARRQTEREQPGAL